MKNLPLGIFRFGAFEFDPRVGELWKNGVRIRLHEQSCRVLTVLLERRGEVVTREELRRALWPEDTFVDFEHGLNSAVNKLREKLSDSAANPRYVETVPRRGYRFIAPATTTGPDTQPEKVPVNPPEQVAGVIAEPAAVAAGAKANGWRKWIGIGAVALALVTATALLRLPNRAPAPRVVPLTTYGGMELTPALSPDGRQVAFVGNIEEQTNADIYVKLVGSEKALRLTSDPGIEYAPAWSPDGTTIAFLRFKRQVTEDLMLVSALGGEERKIAELRQEGVPGPAAGEIGISLSWMPNGEWIAVSETVEGGATGSIYLVSTRTGEKRKLTSPPPWATDMAPAVAPDGRAIAFTRSPHSRNSQMGRALYILRLDSRMVPQREPEQLVAGSWNCGHSAWLGNGREILFSAGSEHVRSLWRVSTSGGEEPRALEYTERRAVWPTIGGSRMAYGTGGADTNIWKLDLTSSAAPAPVRFNASIYVDHMPAFSPDGKRVAFGSYRTGTQEVWVADVDGSQAVRLTHNDPKTSGGPEWAPDGESIQFALIEKGVRSSASVSRSGGRTRQVGGKLSRDGKWMYRTQITDGVPDIWRAPVESASDESRWVQVTTGGGDWARESADGKFLYYARNNSLWRKVLPDGAQEEVLPSLLNAAGWALGRSGIYFTPRHSDPAKRTIEYFDLATGKTRILHTTSLPLQWGLAVSPDERTLLYVQQDATNYDLMLVENFR